MVADFVQDGDADLLDDFLSCFAHGFEVPLVNDHAIGKDAVEAELAARSAASRDTCLEALSDRRRPRPVDPRATASVRRPRRRHSYNRRRSRGLRTTPVRPATQIPWSLAHDDLAGIPASWAACPATPPVLSRGGDHIRAAQRTSQGERCGLVIPARWTHSEFPN